MSLKRYQMKLALLGFPAETTLETERVISAFAFSDGNCNVRAAHAQLGASRAASEDRE